MRRLLIVLVFGLFAIAKPHVALTQQIDCDDPSIISTGTSGNNEQPSVCYDTAREDAAQLHAYEIFQRRSQTLLNEWARIWPATSRDLVRRMRALRNESAAYSEKVELAVPPPDVGWVTTADHQSDIDAVVTQAVRTRYYRLALDAAIAKCPAAVKPFIKAAHIGTDSQASLEPDTVTIGLATFGNQALRTCKAHSH